MLPRIKINFENGALSQSVPSPDGVFGFVLTGTAVVDKFALATPYLLRSLSGLNALGITQANNAHIFKIVSDFYAESADGTETWIIAFPEATKVSEMVDVSLSFAKLLIRSTNGRLRGLFVSRNPGAGYTPTITNGLDADIVTAMQKAQALGEWATDQRYAPVFTILEGYAFNGNAVDLADLTTNKYNRVAIMVGDTLSGSKHAALGLLAGRLAKSPVQVNAGKVKDGPLNTITAFIHDKAIEVADVETIHDKGYITLRTIVGRTGYFFTDDPLATLPGDDYNHLTARRTIDKAYRIAYDALIEELLSEIPINYDGTLQEAMVKNWQLKVEDRISKEMTAFGNLSSDVTDSDDKGVICFIDSSQNVVSSSQINVSIRVRPFGYARYINVALGFQVNNN